MDRITEKDSHYDGLEKMSIAQLLRGINEQDHVVAKRVSEKLGEIEALVEHTYKKMQGGGRLFYIGAGTSGRLGILDASECPPTFGVSHDLVIGLIAGGDQAIRKAVEFAEDDEKQAWEDLKAFNIDSKDTLVGLAASGTTPYVIGGLKMCQKHGISTGCITCNPNSAITKCSDFPIEINVGPEFVTGSTRMKSGTAQKMVLNMISTAVMIKLGRVKGNKMVDMQLSNDKLVDRGTRMVVKETGLSYDQAREMLLLHGSVRKAIKSFGC